MKLVILEMVVVAVVLYLFVYLCHLLLPFKTHLSLSFSTLFDFTFFSLYKPPPLTQLYFFNHHLCSTLSLPVPLFHLLYTTQVCYIVVTMNVIIYLRRCGKLKGSEKEKSDFPFSHLLYNFFHLQNQHHCEKPLTPTSSLLLLSSDTLK